MSESPPITGPQATIAAAPLVDPLVVYERHADFVWRSLQRCGLSSSDLEDAFQEVFLVVQRKLGSFRGDSKLTTWLFGICLRVAKKQRRFSFFRDFASTRSTDVSDSPTPEEDAERQRTREQVQVVLDRLTPEQRAVFTMYELEQLDCAEIAGMMGVPVGTVYSRLHSARARFRQEYHRVISSPRGGRK